MPINVLDEAQVQANDIKTRLVQFASSGDRAQVTNSVGAVDALNRTSLALAGIVSVSGTAKGLQDVVSSYRRSAGQHIGHLKNEAEEFEAKLLSLEPKVGELEQAVKDQKSRVDSVISTQQEQFGQDQQKRAREWAVELRE